jgi:hypothetical protein
MSLGFDNASGGHPFLRADPGLDSTLVEWKPLDLTQIEILHGVLFEKDFRVTKIPSISFKADQIFRSVIAAYIATYKHYLQDQTPFEENDAFCEKVGLVYQLTIVGSTARSIHQNVRLGALSDLDTRLSFSSLPYPDTYAISKNKAFYEEVATRSLRLLFEFYRLTSILPDDIKPFLDSFIVFRDNSLFMMSFAGIDIVFPIPKAGCTPQHRTSFVHEYLHIKVQTKNGLIDDLKSSEIGSPQEFRGLERILNSKTIVVVNPDPLVDNHSFERLCYSCAKGWTILEISHVHGFLRGTHERAQKNKVIFDRGVLGESTIDFIKAALIKGGLLEKLFGLIDKKKCGAHFCLNLFMNAYSVCKILSATGNTDALQMISIFNESFHFFGWQVKFPPELKDFYDRTDGLDLLYEAKTLFNHLAVFESNQVAPHLGKSCRVAGADGRDYGYFISDSLFFSDVVARWVVLESQLSRPVLLNFFQQTSQNNLSLDSLDHLLNLFMKRAFHQKDLSEEEKIEVIGLLPEFTQGWDKDPYFLENSWRERVEAFLVNYRGSLPLSSSTYNFLFKIANNPEFFNLFPLFYEGLYAQGREREIISEKFLRSDFSKKTAIKNCLVAHGHQLDFRLYFELLKVMLQNNPEIFVDEDFLTIDEALLGGLKEEQPLELKQALLKLTLKSIRSSKKDAANKAFSLLLELVKDEAILREFIEKNGMTKLNQEQSRILASVSCEKPSTILFDAFLDGRQIFLEPLPAFLKLEKLIQSPALKIYTDCLINWCVEAYKTQNKQNVNQLIFPALSKLNQEQMMQFAKKLLKEDGDFVNDWLREVCKTPVGLSALAQLHLEIKGFTIRLKRKSEFSPEDAILFTKILLASVKANQNHLEEVSYAAFLLKSLIGVDTPLFIEGIIEFHGWLIKGKSWSKIQNLGNYKTICIASYQLSKQKVFPVQFPLKWVFECETVMLHDFTFEELLKQTEIDSTSGPFIADLERKLQSVSHLNEGELLYTKEILGNSLPSLKKLLSIAKSSKAPNEIIQDLYLKIFNLSSLFSDQLKVLKRYYEVESDKPLCTWMVNQLILHPKKIGVDRALMMDLIERILTSSVDEEILKCMELLLQLPDFQTVYQLIFIQLFIACQSKEKFKFILEIVKHLEKIPKATQQELILAPLFKTAGDTHSYCLFDYLCEHPFDTDRFEIVSLLSTKNKLEQAVWNELFGKFIHFYLLTLEAREEELTPELRGARYKVFSEYISSPSMNCNERYHQNIESVIQNMPLFLQLSDFLMPYMALHLSRFNQKIYLQYLIKRGQLNQRIQDRDTHQKAQLETIFSAALDGKERVLPLRELIHLYESIGGVYREGSRVSEPISISCLRAFSENNREDMAFVLEFIPVLKTLGVSEAVKKTFLASFSKLIKQARSIAELEGIFVRFLELYVILDAVKIGMIAGDVLAQTINLKQDATFDEWFEIIGFYLKPILLKSGINIAINFVKGEHEIFADSLLSDAAALPKFPLADLIKKTAGFFPAFSVVFYDLLLKKYLPNVLEVIPDIRNDPDNLLILETIEKEMFKSKRVSPSQIRELLPVLFSLMGKLAARSAIFNEAKSIEEGVVIQKQDTAPDEEQTLKCLLKILEIVSICSHEIPSLKFSSKVINLIWVSLLQFTVENSWLLFDEKAPLLAVETLSRFDSTVSKMVYLPAYSEYIRAFFSDLSVYSKRYEKRLDIVQPLMQHLIKNIILHCAENRISIYVEFFCMLNNVKSLAFSTEFTKEMYCRNLLEFGISYFSTIDKEKKFTEDLSKPLKPKSDSPSDFDQYCFNLSAAFLFISVEQICHELLPKDSDILLKFPTLFECYFKRGYFLTTPSSLDRWFNCMHHIYFKLNEILDPLIFGRHAKGAPKGISDQFLMLSQLLRQFVCLPSRILSQLDPTLYPSGEDFIATMNQAQRSSLVRILTLSESGTHENFCPLSLITGVDAGRFLVEGLEIESYREILLPLKINLRNTQEPVRFSLEYLKVLVSMLHVMDAHELSPTENRLRAEIIGLAIGHFGNLIYPHKGALMPHDEWKEVLYGFKSLSHFFHSVQTKEDFTQFVKFLFPFIEKAFQEDLIDLTLFESIFAAILFVDVPLIFYEFVEMTKKHKKDNKFKSLFGFAAILSKAPTSRPSGGSSLAGLKALEATAVGAELFKRK